MSCNQDPTERPWLRGEPDESAHFSWAGVVPDSGDGLLSGGVP